jgi:hypothetical protein
MKKYIPYIFGIILGAFGLLTLFLSSSVIFDLFDIRAREGNFVLFVVWANFIASILYLIASFGWLKKKPWTSSLLALAVGILIAAFIGLMIHVSNGGLHEIKTIGAMTFRTTLTLTFAIIAYFNIKTLTR